MPLSSINFAKVKTHSFRHNDRSEFKKAHTVYAEFSHNNICDIDATSAHENFNVYYDEAMKKIEGKVRRAKRENTLVEASVNIKSNTTMEDLKKLQAHIEKEYGFTGLQIAIHRDEGHFKDEIAKSDFIENEHAHMSFFTLNRQTGRQMFRKEHITPEKLRQLQTDGAQILNMDRGRDKRESGVERLGHKEYKRAKKAEEQQLAKENDLKAEIAELRAALKEQGGKREDYAQLEQLNRELKAQLKDKELTIEDLHEQINTHRELITALKSKSEALNEEIINKDEKINSRINEDDFLLIEAKSLYEKQMNVRLKESGTIPTFIVFLLNKLNEFKNKIFGLERENQKLKNENDELRKVKTKIVIDQPKMDIKDDDDWKSKLNEIPDEIENEESLSTKKMIQNK